MIDVATLAEMCQILKIDHTTGAKHWRKWPHFFCNRRPGREIRAVRPGKRNSGAGKGKWASRRTGQKSVLMLQLQHVSAQIIAYLSAPNRNRTASRDKIEPRIEPQKKAPPFLTGQTLFLLALFEPRRVAHGVVVNPAEDYPREDDPRNHRKAS